MKKQVSSHSQHTELNALLHFTVVSLLTKQLTEVQALRQCLFQSLSVGTRLRCCCWQKNAGPPLCRKKKQHKQSSNRAHVMPFDAKITSTSLSWYIYAIAGNTLHKIKNMCTSRCCCWDDGGKKHVCVWNREKKITRLYYSGCMEDEPMITPLFCFKKFVSECTAPRYMMMIILPLTSSQKQQKCTLPSREFFAQGCWSYTI